MIFRPELIWLIGLKLVETSWELFLGMRAMLAQLIRSKLIEPLWKSTHKVRISFSMIYQYFWKKEIGNPSGLNALSAPRSKVARLISSLEKGASRDESFGKYLFLRRALQENMNLESLLIPKRFWKWEANTLPKLSDPSTRIPLSRILEMKFWFLLPFAKAWKNFVFSSPSFNHLALDLCFQ